MKDMHIAYIRRAYSLVIRKGVEQETPVGWDLFLNGEWHERFRLYRTAKKNAVAMGFQIVDDDGE